MCATSLMRVLMSFKAVAGWQLQPNAVEVTRVAGCHRKGKSPIPNNGLICLLVSVTLCSMLLKKTFSGLLWQQATKTKIANKDNSCSSVDVQLTMWMLLV